MDRMQESHLKGKSFIRVTGLIALLVTALTMSVSVVALEVHRRREKEQVTMRGLFVAQQAERLLLLDDRVALTALLAQVVEGQAVVDYAFVERGGSPWAHTFESRVPEAVRGLHGGAPASPEFVEFLGEQDAVNFDLAVPIGKVGAVLHLGVSRDLIDGQMLGTFIYVGVLSLAALGVGIALAARVSAAGTEEVTRTTAALQRSEDRFRTLIQAAGSVIVCLGRDYRILEINRAAEEVLGRTRRDVIGKSYLDQFVEPERRDELRHDIDEIFSGELTGGIEYRLRDAEGRDRTFLLNAERQCDAKGRPTAVMIIGQDITDRVRAQKALAESEEKFRTIVENVHAGVCRTGGDGEGRFLEANPAFAALFGYDSVEELMALPCARVYLDPTDRDAFEKEVAVCGHVRNKEMRLRKKDGTAFWGLMSVKAHFGPDGGVAWTDGVVEDITDRKEAETRLRRAAEIDPLTGVQNRGHFMERLKAEALSAQRYGYPLTMCICDLDGFKFVNDTYGHASGDQLLAAFGGILREAIRDQDVAGRYGGDEFCLFFPHTQASRAAWGVERIRSLLERMTFTTHKGEEFRATATFGLADLPEDGDEAALLAAADDALYRAKRAGRNRVVLSDPRGTSVLLV